MIRQFRQWLHVTVDVKAHGRAGVPETAGKFDGADALLVPEARPSVTQGVWAEPAGFGHSGRETVTADAEWESFVEGVREFFWHGYESPMAFAFARLSADAKERIIHVVADEVQRFAHSEPTEFHHENGRDKVVSEAGE